MVKLSVQQRAAVKKAGSFLARLSQYATNRSMNIGPMGSLYRTHLLQGLPRRSL
jgi:hypothetical protein